MLDCSPGSSFLSFRFFIVYSSAKLLLLFSSHEEAEHFDNEELEGGGHGGGRRGSSAYRSQNRSRRGLTRAHSVEEESPRMPKRGGASASASASASRGARPMGLDYYSTMGAGRRGASKRSRSDPPVDDEFTPRHRSHGYGYTVKA